MKTAEAAPGLQLWFETGDRMAPVLIEALTQAGHSAIALGEECEGPAKDIFFASQNAFLARAFRPLNGEHLSILLRRTEESAGEEEFDRGLALMKALLARWTSGPVSLLALTEESARVFAARLGMAVSVLPRVSGPLSEKRRSVRIDEAARRIYWRRNPIGLDAWNWARLRRSALFDLATITDPDLRDCAEFCNLSGLGAENAPSHSFLIVVPNGVGLGHLTRMLAVADAMTAKGVGRVEFWCYSQGAEIIQAAGYPVHVRFTVKHLGCDVEDWHSWERADMIQTLRRLRPAAVIADGSMLDLTIIEAIKDPLSGAPELVWVRRGMWDPSHDVAPLGGAQFASLVLVPGDLAAARDCGPTANVDPTTQGLATTVETPPVTLTLGNDALGRKEARRALALPRFTLRKTCLVSLGGDAFDLQRSLPMQIKEAAEAAGVRLLWVRSPLAHAPDPRIARKDIRGIYPLGRFLPAFDGAISAAGYNSFHELMTRTRFPVLFAPMEHQRLDKQIERARHAAEMGWADWLDLSDSTQMQLRLKAFFALVRAGKVFTNRPAPEDGADQMAEHIMGLGRD